jgi:hypothetical protein
MTMRLIEGDVYAVIVHCSALGQAVETRMDFFGE